MAKFNEVIPTFRYDQMLHESWKTLPEHTYWDKNADKFVCMNGTASKYNRYRLIVEMDKRNVLKDCVHSIMVLEENRRWHFDIWKRKTRKNTQVRSF